MRIWGKVNIGGVGEKCLEVGKNKDVVLMAWK
jgi:hypothetical protein